MSFLNFKYYIILNIVMFKKLYIITNVSFYIELLYLNCY